MKINCLKTTVIMLLVVLGVALNAQEKETKDKLANLKGKIEKVTIKVDGKDVVFEGKEAEQIAKIAKAAGVIKALAVTTDEEDVTVSGKKKKIKIYTSGGASCCVANTCEDIDLKKDGVQKKVKVEIKDGKKNVTVTTSKDGKEETKTYVGEEADKFIAEEGGDGKVKVIMKKVCGDETTDKDHLICVDKNIKDSCCKNYCKHCGKEQAKIKQCGKGNIKWKMKCSDSNDKEVHIIIDKKKDTKESKETITEKKK
ncbi:MAG: hypothetical protein FD143_2558 [Ignavibacteria bacterium]|nr:MAG: hypothetical protein FD143_2558 [Ignavibacteria bacterium]KAF0156402.1 MAG: hypothetical protein FD188_2972 [Ignavibacteria bacterium]